MSLWTQLVCESAYVANPASLGAACGAGNDLGALTEQPRPRRSDAVSARIVRPPNGSRLSCGRSARGRKELEPRTKRLAGEATQFLPTCDRPPASSAC